LGLAAVLAADFDLQGGDIAREPRPDRLRDGLFRGEPAGEELGPLLLAAIDRPLGLGEGGQEEILLGEVEELPDSDHVLDVDAVTDDHPRLPGTGPFGSDTPSGLRTA